MFGLFYSRCDFSCFELCNEALRRNDEYEVKGVCISTNVWHSCRVGQGSRYVLVDGHLLDGFHDYECEEENQTGISAFYDM